MEPHHSGYEESKGLVVRVSIPEQNLQVGKTTFSISLPCRHLEPSRLASVSTDLCLEMFHVKSFGHCWCSKRTNTEPSCQGYLAVGVQPCIIMHCFHQDVADAVNYGLYVPPSNGRAGKFLEEERLLADYSLQHPVTMQVQVTLMIVDCEQCVYTYLSAVQI